MFLGGARMSSEEAFDIVKRHFIMYKIHNVVMDEEKVLEFLNGRTKKIEENFVNSSGNNIFCKKFQPFELNYCSSDEKTCKQN